MKRQIVFIALFFVTLGLSAQQGLQVKGGLLLSNVTVNGISDAFTPDRAFLPGYQIGVFSEIPMTGALSFVPGIQFAEKGFMTQEGFNVNLFQVPVELGVTAETRLQYLQIPLWLQYTAGNGPIKGYVTGGPTLGYAVDGRIRTKANFIMDFNIGTVNLDLSQNLYNRFEVGAGLGAGVAFDTGKGSILLDASYNYAFTDILADPIVDVKLRNHGLAINLGYKIPLH